MSASDIESAPEPMGAKATDPDPRLQWREERARLGGYDPPVRFTDLQVKVLNAAADAMVPGGDGFPAPSEVDVVDFVSRYVTPKDRECKYFPLAAEETFKSDVDALGQAFVDASEGDKADRIRELENGDEHAAEFFGQLRALFYYGYYASPLVTVAINQNLPAADDYHGPPQPYGYSGKVEPWPDDALENPTGTYLATEDIARIEIPDDIKAEYGVS